MVGAVLFWLLNKFFADYGTWYQMGLGLLAIVVTIGFRQGLWGWITQHTGLTLFPTARLLRSDDAAFASATARQAPTAAAAVGIRPAVSE